MFKIVVFTKTSGAQKLKYYAFVPEKWESNGFVYWPLHLQDKLRRDPTSVPDTAKWTKYKALVKETNIKTLDDALLYEEHYVQADGTDTTDAE